MGVRIWRGIVVLAVPLALAGCGSASELLSKDAEWFSRPTRVFSMDSLTYQAAPLSQTRAVAPDDLISAEGYCAGMGQPAETAMADGAAGGAPSGFQSGIALGSTECEVARYAGAPDSVNLSSGPSGERAATLIYTRGARPGIYQFSGGRLTSIERAPEPPAPPRPARGKRRG